MLQPNTQVHLLARNKLLNKTVSPNRRPNTPNLDLGAGIMGILNGTGKRQY